jgi:hypothetical protein
MAKAAAVPRRFPPLEDGVTTMLFMFGGRDVIEVGVAGEKSGSCLDTELAADSIICAIEFGHMTMEFDDGAIEEAIGCRFMSDAADTMTVWFSVFTTCVVNAERGITSGENERNSASSLFPPESATLTALISASGDKLAPPTLVPPGILTAQGNVTRH